MARVLGIGRMQQVMDRVLGELRAAGYEAEGAIDDDEVVALAEQSRFDVLVIGGGVSQDDRARIIERVTAVSPGIAIAQPSGPGEVMASVRQALED